MSPSNICCCLQWCRNSGHRRNKPQSRFLIGSDRISSDRHDKRLCGRSRTVDGENFDGNDLDNEEEEDDDEGCMGMSQRRGKRRRGRRRNGGGGCRLMGSCESRSGYSVFDSPSKCLRQPSCISSGVCPFYLRCNVD